MNPSNPFGSVRRVTFGNNNNNNGVFSSTSNSSLGARRPSSNPLQPSLLMQAGNNAHTVTPRTGRTSVVGGRAIDATPTTSSNTPQVTPGGGKQHQVPSQYPSLRTLIAAVHGGGGSTSGELETWARNSGVLQVLEALSSHLIRVMPLKENMHREVSSWGDENAQTVSGAGSAGLSASGGARQSFKVKDVTTVRVRREACAGALKTYEVLWHDQLCWLELLQRNVPHTAGGVGASGDQARQRHYCKLNSLVSALPKLHQFRHDHIVEIWGSHRGDTEIALLCEYCPEGSVRDMLRRLVEKERSRLSLGTVFEICADVLRGLQCLHTWSLIHRALTCNNVLCVRPAVVGGTTTYKLGGLEYCVLSQRDVVTSAGWLPAHTPTEVLQTCCYDTPADVYAFAYFIRELVTYGEVADDDIASALVNARVLPVELIEKIVAPSLASSESRPTITHLLGLATHPNQTLAHTIETLIAPRITLERGLHDVYIPTPSESRVGVTWEMLSTIRSLGFSLDAFSSTRIDVPRGCPLRAAMLGLRLVFRFNAAVESVTMSGIAATIEWSTATRDRMAARFDELVQSSSHDEQLCRSKPRLRHLELRECVFGETGALILELLQAETDLPTSLETLRLPTSPVPEGTQAWRILFAEILPSARGLTELDLSNWGEGSSLFSALADACSSWCASPECVLRKIDVSGNLLSSHSLYALCCHIVSKLDNIEELVCNGTEYGRIDYTALNVLVQCVRYRRSLKKLSLANTPLTTASLGLLAQLVTHNKSIVCLEYDDAAAASVSLAQKQVADITRSLEENSRAADSEAFVFPPQQSSGGDTGGTVSQRVSSVSQSGLVVSSSSCGGDSSGVFYNIAEGGQEL